MWEWHIANLGEKHVERRPIEPSAYRETTELFEAAADASVLDGRAVAGMWVVDLDSEQEDVILLHGRAPAHIHARHHAYRQEGRNRRSLRPAKKSPAGAGLRQRRGVT